MLNLTPVDTIEVPKVNVDGCLVPCHFKGHTYYIFPGVDISVHSEVTPQTYRRMLFTGVIQSNLMKRSESNYRKVMVPEVGTMTHNHLIALNSVLVYNNQFVIGACQIEDQFDDKLPMSGGRFYFGESGSTYGRVTFKRAYDIHRWASSAPLGDLIINGQGAVYEGNVVYNHWQPERQMMSPGLDHNWFDPSIKVEALQEPHGVRGSAGCDLVVTGDGWLYLFVGRIVDARVQNWNPAQKESYGYPPHISNFEFDHEDAGRRQLYFSGSTVVMRARIRDVLRHDFHLQPNPFLKWHDGEWQSDPIGGLDTAVINNSFFTKVHWNTYLNKWVAVGQTGIYPWPKCIIHLSDDLMNWEVYQEIDQLGHYPNFINEDGTNDRICGKRSWFTYRPYRSFHWMRSVAEWD